ncbi:MAG: hypothetical protein LBV40_05200 [Methanomicrobiales archaeon]|jgi:hypothetical protein|nr:hypothetical protein [Methanomicrobiales archaeon]
MKKTYIQLTIHIVLGILLIGWAIPGIWAEKSEPEEITGLEIKDEIGGEETLEIVEMAPEITQIMQSSNAIEAGIMLYEGWNLVATPRTLDKSANTAKIFGDVNADGHSIWTYDVERGGWIDLIQDDVIKPLYGYWVYTTQKQWVPLTYNTDPLMVPPSRALAEGWNLVGLSGIQDATARDAFLSVRKVWTNIIGWDEEKQSYEGTILNGGDEGRNEMISLSTGNAYWVFITEPGIMAALDA